MSQPLIYKPLDVWPGKLRAPGERTAAQFKVGLDKTERELRHELWHHVVGTEAAVVQVAIPHSEWRQDGTPRVRARHEHPGVVVTFNSRHDRAPMRFATDRFTEWYDNLRAIRLALEDMRRIERYGIGTGREQYAGFRAIGSGIAMPAAAMTPMEAAQVLVECARSTMWSWVDVVGNHGVIDVLHGEASKNYHPDRGGSHETMVRINQARDLLKGHLS